MYGTPTERDLDKRVTELETAIDMMLTSIEGLTSIVEILIAKTKVLN